jgi:hypothetical protein
LLEFSHSREWNYQFISSVLVGKTLGCFRVYHFATSTANTYVAPNILERKITIF